MPRARGKDGGHPGLTRDPLAVLQATRRHGDLVRLRIGLHSVHVVDALDLPEQKPVTNGRLFERVRPVIGSGLPCSASPDADRKAERSCETGLDSIVDHHLDADVQPHSLLIPPAPQTDSRGKKP